MSATDVRDYVVALDYGQFSLETDPEDFLTTVDLIDRASAAGDRIAQDSGLVLVLTPHQWNFELALRRELHDVEPADDSDGWDEVHEATVEVGDHGLWFASPTMDSYDLEVPAGRYRARMVGRGFGWNPETPEHERWRIQLWPDAVASPARCLKAWRPPGGGGRLS